MYKTTRAKTFRKKFNSNKVPLQRKKNSATIRKKMLDKTE